MTENKKTEKWSSLRLDFQQFSPQEFVAACWYFDCEIIVNNQKYITSDKTGNHGSNLIGTLDHNYVHRLTTQTAPAPSSSGYIWTTSEKNKYTVGGDNIRYVYFDSKYHVGTSNWIQSSNPNVSG